MQHGHQGTAPGGSRLVGVDALRGLAAIAVCLFHWERIAFGTDTAEQRFRLGLLGVELFFVISGFVILMVAERARSVPSFVLARMLRLYPAYLASVALTAVCVLWVGKYDIGAVLVNLTMLQSFVDMPNITNPYWTLAFELSFYGLLTVVLASNALGRIERLALAWLAAALAYRLLVPGPLGFDPDHPLAQLGYILVAPQFAPFFVIGLMVYRLRAGQLRLTGALALAAALALTLFGRADFAQVPGPVYGLFACAATVTLWWASAPLARTGAAGLARDRLLPTLPRALHGGEPLRHRGRAVRPPGSGGGGALDPALARARSPAALRVGAAGRLRGPSPPRPTGRRSARRADRRGHLTLLRGAEPQYRPKANLTRKARFARNVSDSSLRSSAGSVGGRGPAGGFRSSTASLSFGGSSGGRGCTVKVRSGDDIVGRPGCKRSRARHPPSAHIGEIWPAA